MCSCHKKCVQYILTCICVFSWYIAYILVLLHTSSINTFYHHQICYAVEKAPTDKAASNFISNQVWRFSIGIIWKKFSRCLANFDGFLKVSHLVYICNLWFLLHELKNELSYSLYIYSISFGTTKSFLQVYFSTRSLPVPAEYVQQCVDALKVHFLKENDSTVRMKIAWLLGQLCNTLDFYPVHAIEEVVFLLDAEGLFGVINSAEVTICTVKSIFHVVTRIWMFRLFWCVMFVKILILCK